MVSGSKKQLEATVVCRCRKKRNKAERKFWGKDEKKGAKNRWKHSEKRKRDF